MQSSIRAHDYIFQVPNEYDIGQHHVLIQRYEAVEHLDVAGFS